MKYTQSFCFVSVIVLSSSVHLHGQNNKMNVLLIIADDMRPELGCYGIEDIVTPRLDSLARYATVFQNAYCNIPVSGASRASLFTGMYPRYRIVLLRLMPVRRKIVRRLFHFRNALRRTDIMSFLMEKYFII